MDNKRFGAGMVDFIITAIIQSILMFIFILKPMMSNELQGVNIPLKNLMVTDIALCYLIFRDVLGSKSIGKKILKLKIIDENTGNPCNFLRRLLRNITWILGPIEVIFLLVSKKRLGDILAKTKVVEDK